MMTPQERVQKILDTIHLPNGTTTFELMAQTDCQSGRICMFPYIGGYAYLFPETIAGVDDIQLKSRVKAELIAAHIQMRDLCDRAIKYLED